MLSFESKYLTLNDSRVVANATISLGTTSIDLRDYDFSRFSEEQRKVIFRWTRNVDFFDYGPTFKSTLLSKKQVVINLSSTAETISIELAGERVTLDSTPLPAGIYHLDLAIYLDRPLEALGEVPDHIKPMLEYSEIVNVTAVLSELDKAPPEIERYPGPVYDGAARLGFFLADIDKMDAFIKQNLSGEIIDLQREFCETEIANYLFEAGLLVLVWGMTPWHYYIHGLARCEDVDLVPNVPLPQFNGRYKVRDDIQELSVVPGEQLLNWPSCRTQEWPKIALPGSGESVSVDVHLRGFDPIPGEFGPLLAVITVQRTDADPEIVPLLAVDIESVEAGPGY
jgi:hypothetical protein